MVFRVGTSWIPKVVSHAENSPRESKSRGRTADERRIGNSPYEFTNLEIVEFRNSRIQEFMGAVIHALLNSLTQHFMTS
jgi:hypothetical protein